jgi:hypothetical protein
MTQQPVAAQPAPLDPAILAAMLRSTDDSIPLPPAASADEIDSRRQAAQITTAAMRPRDPVEANLAARYVAMHHAIMENMRCAAQADLPADLKLRHTGKALALARMCDVTLRGLEFRQAHPALDPVAVLPPLPAPRPRPVMVAAPGTPAPQPAAAQPSIPQPSVPQSAVPQSAAPQALALQPKALQPAAPAAALPASPKPQASLAAPLQHDKQAPRCAVLAPLTAAEAARERMLDTFTARALPAPSARAA